MKERTPKFKCETCGVISLETELLTAVSPFRDDDHITACPACRWTGEFSEVCDREGCGRHATTGTPTKDGKPMRSGDPESDDYLRLCSRHWDELFKGA
jgi:hypothetical protein